MAEHPPDRLIESDLQALILAELQVIRALLECQTEMMEMLAAGGQPIPVIPLTG